MNADLCVPSLGVQRRLRALAVIGWGMNDLAPRLGVHRTRVMHLRQSRTSVISPETAEKIAALYEELHMLPGPSTATRSRAVRAGWAPPLAWDNIDDPDEVPQWGAPVDEKADEGVVRAFLANRPPPWGRMTEADRELLVGELRRLGFARNAIALATHASHQQVRRVWEKVGA